MDDGEHADDGRLDRRVGGQMGGRMGGWVERRKEGIKQGKAGRRVVEGWAGRELDG